eukprot:9324234-Pyramimonas_sp.AAC.1
MSQTSEDVGSKQASAVFQAVSVEADDAQHDASQQEPTIVVLPCLPLLGLILVSRFSVDFRFRCVSVQWRLELSMEYAIK